ncbi:enoyl-ACP reductase FabV [Streptomyces gamaensis]|uniref:trans-2-enoyl-CoA reductase (NAD(+)) n=1 Tax=Streptomyces gamaensis TaxID=1763542 RepID=A0ABW0YWZ8_9ACTN
MIIEPVTRGLLCATAHPDGCAARVRAEIDEVRGRPSFRGPRNALVIGASAGLGLSTRVALGFGAGAASVGVCLERPPAAARAASAGWYNTAALESEFAAAGILGRTVVGDAFGERTKQTTAEVVKRELGSVDLVVYSLAAPRREHDGVVHRSTLKTVGTPFTEKSYDAESGRVALSTMPAATLGEIRETVSVMGGDDWQRWLEVLHDAGVLAPDVTTVAFSYVGNSWLAPSYRGGTLGKAKEHLEWTARGIDETLRPAGGRAHAAVMRALVTQASSVLPVQTLYAILLSRVARESGLHETVLDQAYRLCAERLYGPGPLAVDEEGRIRLDERELHLDVQAEVRRRWNAVDTENIAELGALDAYRAETLALYGFGVPGVDYAQDTDPLRDIPGVVLA